MFEILFDRGFKSARRLLEKKNVDLKALAREIDNDQMQILLAYVEGNLLHAEFEVLHSPCILETRMGPIVYPFIIQTEGREMVHLVWSNPWDPEMVRQMLSVFGLYKKHGSSDASFVVLSPHNAPGILEYFAQDNPWTRLHLLNMVDMFLEPAQRDPVEVFIENFRRSYHQEIVPGSEGLEIFDRIAGEGIKPPTSQIHYSEPVLATVNLLGSFLERSVLQVCGGELTGDGYQCAGPAGAKYLFDMNIHEKIHRDFSRPGTSRFSRFAGEISSLMKDPTRIPNRGCFAYFSWDLPPEGAPRRRHDGKVRELILTLNRRRQEQIKEQGQRAESWVGWIYFCRHCGKHFIRSARLKRGGPFRLDSSRRKAHRLASPQPGKKYPCRCSHCHKNIDYQWLRYQLYCRFLPDVEWDIQYQLDRDESGRLMGSWRGVPGEGHTQYLGHRATDQAFFAVFRRHISTDALWRDLFEWVLEHRRPDLVRVEDYYHLMLVPPLQDESLQKHLETLLEPFVSVDREYRQYNLLTLCDEKDSPPEQSFLHWLWEYAPLVTNLSHEAVVFIDMDLLDKKVRMEMEGMGIHYDPCGSLKYVVSLGPVTTNLDIEPIIPHMIHTGEIPGEVILRKLETVRDNLYRTGEFIDTVNRIAGKSHLVRFLPGERTLLLKNRKSGHKTRLSLDELIESYGWQGTALEEELRDILGLSQKNKHLCKCGKKAYITMRFIPKKKLEELSRSNSSRPITRDKDRGDDLAAYYHCCSDGHLAPVTPEVLRRWKMGINNLARQLKKDLPLSHFNLSVYRGSRSGHQVIAVTGPHGASLGIEPAWIRRLMDRLQFDGFGSQCQVLAPTTGLLVIGARGTSRRVMEDFARELLSGPARESGTPLNYSALMDLPQRGVGRISILSIHQI